MAHVIIRSQNYVCLVFYESLFCDLAFQVDGLANSNEP